VSNQDRKYTKTHEWVSLETEASSTTATIGITAFALQSLTDLVFIDLPAVGREVRRGESFGEVESVKAVSDLYSPVDGQIVAVNTEASGDLKRLSDDPYGFGWLVKIAVSDEAGLKELLDETSYKKQCEQELAEE